MKGKLIAFFITAIMLSSIVFGAVSDDVKTAVANDLNARYQYLSCRVDLTNSQIDSFAKYIGGVDLSSQKAKLTSDLSTLNGYAQSGDRDSFNSYVTTIKGDFQAVTSALKGAKANIKGMNITKENIASLRSEVNSERNAFGQCNANAEKSLVTAQIAYIQAWINHWNDVISKMQAKGYDVSGMQAVVSDAQNKLIPALQAIESATDASAIKQARENARDLSLHLWARFQIARLQAIMAKVQPKITSTDDQNKLADFNSKLSEASQLATAGKPYSDGDLKTVWSDIRDAAKDLRDIVQDIRQASKAAAPATPATPAENGSSAVPATPATPATPSNSS